MTYKVVQCPKCGQAQVTASTVLRCKYCSRSTKITSKTGSFRVNVIKSFPTPQEASLFIQSYKEKTAI